MEEVVDEKVEDVADGEVEEMHIEGARTVTVEIDALVAETTK